MCGRAAQTVNAAHFAASSFGAKQPEHTKRKAPADSSSSQDKVESTRSSTDSSNADAYAKQDRDNYNMSPGMDAAVIWMENGELKIDRKVWGLVTKGGSSQHPLPSDSKSRMGTHFANLMYNARTDTLFEKPTFSRLARQKQSCIVALDGYFEWKASTLAGGKGKKQPYFVYRSESKDSNSGVPEASNREHPPYLIMAGLWTRVPTGLSDEPFLDTFTILTTEACKQIEWLHHRMPVCIWDMDLAKKWLSDPSPKVHREVDQAAKSHKDGFAWHMVTTEMSSVKFREKEAIEPKKGPKPVTAFFAKMEAESSVTKPPAKAQFTGSIDSPPNPSQGEDESTKQPTSLKKRGLPSPSNNDNSSSSSPPTPKKVNRRQPEPSKKKGLITSFFQKKT